MKDAAEVFTEIYNTKAWGEGSGGGSTPELVPQYISFINWLIEQERPQQVLDIGCGYGWIARDIDWKGANYIGVDVVSEVVLQAWRNLGRGFGSFLALDAIRDRLPDADMVLLKEVTQHLDNASIFDLIGNLEKFPLVIHCSVEPDGSNRDIVMGQTRGVDLSRSPFNLDCRTMLRYELPGSKYLVQLWRPS